jgi:hypothetical protein
MSNEPQPVIKEAEIFKRTTHPASFTTCIYGDGITSLRFDNEDTHWELILPAWDIKQLSELFTFTHSTLKNMGY